MSPDMTAECGGTPRLLNGPMNSDSDIRQIRCSWVPACAGMT